MKRARGAPWSRFEPAPGDRSPLHVQVYQHVRGAILTGVLRPGARLPASRVLARDLGVSRNTAEAAYSQLDAEGYLARRVGDGTYVSRSIPEQPLARPARSRQRGTPPRRRRGDDASAWRRPEPTGARPFAPGVPALDAFPYDTWHRLVVRRSKASGARLLGHGDGAGYRPLREAIAAYLTGARGVACTADRVIIVTSAQQALDLTVRVLLERGDEAWLEDPCYSNLRVLPEAAGIREVAVPVDDRGLRVDRGEALAPAARVAYVTPSHHYPLGVTLALERRLALLAWAERAGAWIVEDDYDGEYRFVGRPLAAIQGLDTSGRVLHLGTLGKVVFPALRLAYLVVPDAVVDDFIAAKSLADGHTASFAQAVLADFIADGHLGAHVRRMRALYLERRDALLRAVARELGAVRLGPADGGLHVAAYLPRGVSDVRLSDRAAAAGLEVPALSRYYRRAPSSGLVLGYAATPPAAIWSGVRTLARLLATPG